MSLREGLHVLMQCYMRQHFADRWLHEHPGGHASQPLTSHNGPVCRWNVQRMQLESSEYVRNSTGFFTNSWSIKLALESYFEEHAQEVWEKWMNPEMQTDVVEHVPSKIDCDDSEGTSRTTQRK